MKNTTKISPLRQRMIEDMRMRQLRYGSPNDANLHGFKICDIPGVLCASQEYLVFDSSRYIGLFLSSPISFLIKF